MSLIVDFFKNKKCGGKTKYPIQKYPITKYRVPINRNGHNPCQYSPRHLKYQIKDGKLIYDIDYQGLVHISVSQLKRVSIQLLQLLRDAI